MRLRISFPIIPIFPIFAGVAIAFAAGPLQADAQSAGRESGRGGPPMSLTISAWPDGGHIPTQFTAAGNQTSPPLSWANAPAGTQGFVVNMLDADAALQRGTETQPHWLVWNIPDTATGLPEGVKPGPELPNGARQISASGAQYRGPGSPATAPYHHYVIEVYALDTKLDVAPSAATQPSAAALETRAAVMKAMQGHVLGKAVYVGMFRRPQ